MAASASQSEVEESIVAAGAAGEEAEAEAAAVNDAEETERDDSYSKSVIEEEKGEERADSSCPLPIRKR